MHLEESVSSISEAYETTCWGCGLRVLLSSYSLIFKCGWCGAITDEHVEKSKSSSFWWRRLRDWFFVCVLLVFMLIVIGAGVWAVYPVVFSICHLCGIFHSIITSIFAVTTVSTFCLASFRNAGPPPIKLWGSCSVLQKGGLTNYKFCHYCSKPKSPTTHHCRSCRTCISEMDHHCPFIGNCVGAANHRYFIIFLISAVLSTVYVLIMSVYGILHMWPPLMYKNPARINVMSGISAMKFLKEIFIALLTSTTFLSTRGLVVIYLFVASVSVVIGLFILLWQQLCYIYEGKTYLSSLASKDGYEDRERDCQNLARFFGFTFSKTRYLPTFMSSRKNRKMKL